ncbi:sigma-54 interaction domain-containing protein [Candidatus Uabimicrobium sp. HlEnr_7]|uniref:sigma-54 interaction domain-containing protein n=1 Tax=Candidatus Uabimicrobium helgolandensis TaxID=3095367 RepID=UPI003558A0F5
MLTIENFLDAVAGKKTRVALVRSIATMMSTHISLLQFEIVWSVNEGKVHATYIEKNEEMLVVQNGCRTTKDSFVFSGLSLPHASYLNRKFSFSEEKKAKALGAKIFILLPLDDSCFVSFSLDCFYEFSDIFLRQIAKVLHLACQQCLLIEKISTLSRNAIEESTRLRQENKKYIYFNEITRSDKMRSVLSKVELVASHLSTVLIRGESGSGKEIIARHIHDLSPRKNKAFVAVNCGALPETLAENELFGHEKGAFTGSFERYIGRIERAHEGTLFLDEVAELSLATQVKLLRFIEERKIERLGGKKSIAINTKIIAATHQPLEEMIKAKTFREDLYYRLNVFPINLPPLRERKEDIPLLVHQLSQKIAKRLHLKMPKISEQAIDHLFSHSWPGNIRELSNIIERALILGQNSEWLQKSHFLIGNSVYDNNQVDTLDLVIKNAIEKALQSSKGQIYGKEGAAILLGLKPSTLQSKMKKLGISRDGFA